MAGFNVVVSPGEIASELADDMEEFADVLYDTANRLTIHDYENLKSYIKNRNDSEKTKLKGFVIFLASTLEMD